MEIIQIFNKNSLKNFSYLLKSKDGLTSICIDPYDSTLIQSEINRQNIRLTHVLNTHQHHDHIRGNLDLIRNNNAKLLVLEDKQSMVIDDYVIESVQSYGHTMDHYTFKVSTESKLIAMFTGDTIFGAGVGNCKNGGDPTILFSTISMLQNIINAETILYTGHDYIMNNLMFAKSIWKDNKEIDKSIQTVSNNYKNNIFTNNKYLDELKINPFFNLSYFKKHFNLKSEENTFYYLRKLRDEW